MVVLAGPQDLKKFVALSILVLVLTHVGFSTGHTKKDHMFNYYKNNASPTQDTKSVIV